jgi:hypothetical protein
LLEYVRIWSQCKEQTCTNSGLYISFWNVNKIYDLWTLTKLSYGDSSLCNVWIFTLLGPDELSHHLDSIPTDQHLRRFAIQFKEDHFRHLMINLEMGDSRIEQIFSEHRRCLHDAMFYCLWTWRGSATNPSFSALKTALEMSDLTSDYLLKVSTPSLLI